MSFIHFANWDQVQEQSILGNVAANLLEPLATGSAGKVCGVYHKGHCWSCCIVLIGRREGGGHLVGRQDGLSRFPKEGTLGDVVGAAACIQAGWSCAVHMLFGPEPGWQQCVSGGSHCAGWWRWDALADSRLDTARCVCHVWLGWW